MNTIVISTINLCFFVATFFRHLNANGGPFIGILSIKNDGYPLVIWFYMVLYGKYPLEMDVLYGFIWEYMGKSWEYMGLPSGYVKHSY